MPPKPKWNSIYTHTFTITHPILSAIESCSSTPHLKQIQAHMTRSGLISHTFPFSRLLLAFALSPPPANFRHARLLFSLFPHPNTHMFNTMIRAHTHHSSPRLALSLFAQMTCEESPQMDSRTFVFAIKACEHWPRLVGEQMHSLILKVGFGLELLVGNSLMHLYVKWGDIGCARKVFDEMGERDVVSWTTIIDGCSQMGFANEGLEMFCLMQSTDVRANEVTMISVLSACSLLGILIIGKCIHGYTVTRGVNISVNLMNSLLDMYGKCGCVESARKVFDGMESKDVFTWTSMMDAHAKCGDLEHARRLFNEMPERNAVSWSCMIAGYSQANRPKEALDLFHEMISSHVKPIDATLVSALSACAQNGCLDLGRWIYTHYIHEKRINLTVKLANAFIDMYGKCGAIDEAIKLFFEMPERNVVSWNTMIITFAFHGYGKEALNLFEQFKDVGFVPNDITFVGVLSACSHIGLVVEARKHFKDLKMIYGIEPKAAHYACLIDLLGRVGLLDEAYELLMSMPMEPDEAAWGALLNACRMHTNVELGKHVGDKLLGLDPGDSGTYALLSNIYATNNRWDDVKRVRRLMRERGIKKSPGCSSIEVEGKSYEFFAADKSHVLSKDIYLTLSVIYEHLRWEDYASGIEDCYLRCISC